MRLSSSVTAVPKTPEESRFGTYLQSPWVRGSRVRGLQTDERHTYVVDCQLPLYTADIVQPLAS